MTTTYPTTMRAINLITLPSWDTAQVSSTSDLKSNPTQPFPKPQPNQLLLKVHAVAISANELSWQYPPSDEPRVVCHDIAAQILALPTDGAALGFKVGDRVFGLISFYGQGGMAEYTVAEPELLAEIPDGLSYVDAASFPRASLTVWQAMKVQGGGVLRTGDNVLILGATGAVGRMAIQMIREFVGREGKVIGMGGNGGEDAKELGADILINYREVESWTQEVENLGVEIDIVFDCVGKKTLEAALSLVKTGGKVITVGSPPPQYTGVKGWDEFEKRGDGFFFIVGGNGEQQAEIAKLVEKGVVKASISRVVDGLDQEGVQNGWAAALKGTGKPGTTVVKVV